MGKLSGNKARWRLRQGRPEVGFDLHWPWGSWEEAVKAWSFAKDRPGEPVGLERWDGERAERVEIDPEAMERELARMRWL